MSARQRLGIIFEIKQAPRPKKSSIHGEFDLDPDMGSFYICSIPAHEGRRPEAVLRAEQEVASRGCARNAGSGGSETARRALRPVLRGARCTCSAGNGGAGNADPKPKIATVWSAERRGVPIARDAGAPRKRPGPAA